MGLAHQFSRYLANDDKSENELLELVVQAVRHDKYPALAPFLHQLFLVMCPPPGYQARVAHLQNLLANYLWKFGFDGSGSMPGADVEAARFAREFKAGLANIESHVASLVSVDMLVLKDGAPHLGGLVRENEEFERVEVRLELQADDQEMVQFTLMFKSADRRGGTFGGSWPLRPRHQRASNTLIAHIRLEDPMPSVTEWGGGQIRCDLHYCDGTPVCSLVGGPVWELGEVGTTSESALIDELSRTVDEMVGEWLACTPAQREPLTLGMFRAAGAIARHDEARVNGVVSVILGHLRATADQSAIRFARALAKMWGATDAVEKWLNEPTGGATGTASRLAGLVAVLENEHERWLRRAGSGAAVEVKVKHAAVLLSLVKAFTGRQNSDENAELVTLLMAMTPSAAGTALSRLAPILSEALRPDHVQVKEMWERIGIEFRTAIDESLRNFGAIPLPPGCRMGLRLWKAPTPAMSATAKVDALAHLFDLLRDAGAIERPIFAAIAAKATATNVQEWLGGLLVDEQRHADAQRLFAFAPNVDERDITVSTIALACLWASGPTRQVAAALVASGHLPGPVALQMLKVVDDGIATASGDDRAPEATAREELVRVVREVAGLRTFARSVDFVDVEELRRYVQEPKHLPMLPPTPGRDGARGPTNPAPARATV